VPAALVGLAVYCILFAFLRPPGVRQSWAYVHGLQ
jgi:hypothetical protein